MGLDSLHQRFIAESITIYCPPQSTGGRDIHGEIVALFIGQTRIDLDEAEKAEFAQECLRTHSRFVFKLHEGWFQIAVPVEGWHRDQIRCEFPLQVQVAGDFPNSYKWFSSIDRDLPSGLDSANAWLSRAQPPQLEILRWR